MPITKDPALFVRGAALGRRLIWLHTYGERCVPSGSRAGRVPAGRARIAAGTPTDVVQYPREFRYDRSTQELHVGAGRFTGVRPEVWDFGVSGLQVVKSWLDYRMLERAGKSSSPLDALRPAGWQFDDELLDLLWVLDATVDLLPDMASLLDEVLAGDLFAAGDFPTPGDAERHGPGVAASLSLFVAAGLDEDGGAGTGDEA